MYREVELEVKMKKIAIKGREFPIRVTMGAIMRFKRETGKDISGVENDISELAVFMFCCVVSACKADGIEFSMSLEEFADNISLEDFAAFQNPDNKDFEQGKKKPLKKCK